MKKSINRSLIIGFSLSLGMLIISSVASYTSIQKLLSTSALVDHTNEIIADLDNIVADIREAEAGQRGYLLTDKEVFLEPSKNAFNNIMTNIDEVSQLTVDNSSQQKSVEELRQLVMQRLNYMEALADKKNANKRIDVADLEKGNRYMLQITRVVKLMKNREKQLLSSRTERQSRFSSYTPILIINAALLSIIITVFFYMKVRRDFAEKNQLQLDLEAKEAEMINRLAIIHDVATRIADGDYETRVGDEGKDVLGGISVTLNKMAYSLQASFEQLTDKEWLQSGVAGLNDKMLGEQTIEELCISIIDYVASYTKSMVGAVYIAGAHDLKLVAGYALGNIDKDTIIPFGEGLAGQCAASRQVITVSEIPDEHLYLKNASGNIKPHTVVAIPIFYDNVLKAVIELASVHGYKERKYVYFREIQHQIGIAITTAQNRHRLQELLEETQSQAEELQAQHNELENLNAELEMQAQKLQASEEELKVQQEELLQANQELEERSRMLEDRNELIVERNIEIQAKAEELALSTRYKSEFLANMSHELRTPLNSILLLSRLLAENNDGNLSEDQTEYARVIQNSGNGLLSLIDEILDLSKIESGKMDVDYGEAALEEIADSISSVFQPMAKEKKLHFAVNVDSDLPSVIDTDRQRLEQVLKNLLSNALKFTEKGSVELNIYNNPKDDKFICFAVKDTGIGIPQDKQAAIFEAFQQADGSTRRKYGGTGLGLSISKEIVKLLGGELQIVSEPGKGSEFIACMPKERTASVITADPLDELKQINTEAQEALVTSAKPSTYRVTEIPEAIPDDRENIVDGDKVILIVEDDTSFAKALLSFTHKKGYKGIVSVRGDEGITLAEQYLPLAIMLDIQLPVKDGWEVMDALKKNRKTRHIPVHIMSSHQLKQESLMKGAIDFINKPIALEQIKDIFTKLELVISKEHKKVMIIEENPKHAQALAYFLENFSVTTEISSSISDSVSALNRSEVECVILDMDFNHQQVYEALENFKKDPELENVPIIVFTGKALNKSESQRLKQYADTIVVKTAHSYQRILDEVTLFLHMVEENGKSPVDEKKTRLGTLSDVIKDRKVLIADDDVRNIYSLSKILEHHKMQVVSAIDGKEALQMLDEHKDIDIVLMDIMMPEMDGYEAIRHIRANPGTKNLPIIAITAKAMAGDREKCINAGASDYISKPVDTDQLLSLLRVWLYERGI